jgi:type IV secretory pathway protease TraF
MIRQVLISIVAVILFTSLHMGRNTSDSVPFKWYLYGRYAKHTVGDYIVFKAEADPLEILPEGTKLVKLIMCQHGMLLRSEPEGFYCGDVLIARRCDPDMMTFNFSGIIPEDKYFVIGLHPRSYDSRIWGLLDEENIIGTVHPLF